MLRAHNTVPCPYCRGNGTQAEQLCKKCNGNGIIPLSEVGHGHIIESGEDDCCHD